VLSLAATGLSSFSAAEPAAAQSLEELIPDEAVAQPQVWAAQGEAPEGGDQAPQPSDQTREPAVAAPESEELAWPASDEALEPPAPLMPEQLPAFAKSTAEAAAPLVDSETVKLGSALELRLPENFPVRDEFVKRFSALSTIQKLQSSDENAAQLSARAREDEKLLDQLLRSYGYYDAYVFHTLAGSANGNGSPSVRFEIQPGSQFHFGEIDLGHLDQAVAEQDAIRSAFAIHRGDPVLSDWIVSERQKLADALGEAGYAFAKVGEPSLLIDHDRTEADLTLPVEPEGNYEFGKVASLEPEFLSSRHLSSLTRFGPGDTFRRSDEADLRRAILATGLVSSVQITPRKVVAPTGGAPGVVDLDVDMAPAPLRSVAAGIGYGTGEGFQLSGSWEHRNLLPPEGMLRLRGILGTREQLTAITFRRNNLGGRDRVLTIDLSARSENWDAYEARTGSATATFERKSTMLFQKRFS